MSIKIEGKVNLLSGFYKDIIISENKYDEYRIVSHPNKRYQLTSLDPTYNHLDLKQPSNKIVDDIIDYFLHNNKICMLSYKGKLKFHEGKYFAINAYEEFIDGLRQINNALFLKIKSKKEDRIKKIEEYYRECRIRSLDEIISKQRIRVYLQYNSTGYLTNADTAEIILKGHMLREQLTIEIDDEELIFLKELIKELVLKGYNHIRYEKGLNVIYDDTYHNKIEIDENIPYKTILNIYNEVKLTQHEYEYFGENLIKVRKKII